MPPRKTQQITTSYANRKTFADHIVENFAKYNRRGYYQRVLFVSKHKVPAIVVKKTIMECVRKTNENLSNEILTGVCLYYTNYSTYAVEGLEDVIGSFMENVVFIKDIIFEMSYILIIINNIRKLLCPKFIFRTAEPPTTLEKIFDTDESSSEMEQGILITRFLAFCREIASEIDIDDEDDDDDEEKEFVALDYRRLLLSTQRIEFILTTNNNMFELSYYLDTFRQVPILENYDELVWPISYDYTPIDVFKKDKYDVNLTFPEEKNK